MPDVLNNPADALGYKSIPAADIEFYSNLPALSLPITEIFRSHRFSDVPADWHVIIADVKNSTGAVNAGKHNDVNLVAAGSLIAALNVAKKRGLDIPFFFGGDGGTVLVPEALLKEVLADLSVHNANSIKNFDLEMHIGSLSVKDILTAGHSVKLAKMYAGNGFHKALVIGDGLRFAEQQIKGGQKKENEAEETEDLNLTGLECRWDRVKPPADEAEIVCYLIESLHPENHMDTYSRVLQKIDEVYGNIEKRNPLSLNRLKLLLDVNKIKKELLAKYGRLKNHYVAGTLLETFVGRIFFALNWKIGNVSSREYLRQLIHNADTLTVDGRINTIICGQREKRIAFLQFLAAEEKAGNLIYGHHISKESVMTCYIQNRNDKHIHFVDGSEGGYTEAAKEFKIKLRKNDVV